MLRFFPCSVKLSFLDYTFPGKTANSSLHPQSFSVYCVSMFYVSILVLQIKVTFPVFSATWITSNFPLGHLVHVWCACFAGLFKEASHSIEFMKATRVENITLRKNGIFWFFGDSASSFEDPAAGQVFKRIWRRVCSPIFFPITIYISFY